MQFYEPRDNPNWLALNEDDRLVMERLLDATLMEDFNMFMQGMESLEKPGTLQNVWPCLPDLPLWSVAQMKYTVNHEPGQWRDSSAALRSREAMEPFMEFWTGYLKLDSLSRVDYRTYHEHFCCADPEQDDDDVLEWCDEWRKRRGQRFRRIDRSLYCHAARFDFDRTETLLAAGGNVHARLDGDGQSILDRISWERSYLATCEYGSAHDRYSELCTLIGLAAHMEMYDLLCASGKR